LVGVLLFLVSFPVLFWNEGRAVDTEQALETGAKNVVSAPADAVDPANDGKLVHITAATATDDTLTDPVFGVKALKAVRLIRNVEMYQYKEESHTETHKKLGGGEETVTTYTYPEGWYAELQNSSDFHDPEYKGKNPSAMPYNSDRWQAQKVTAGAFELSQEQIGRITDAKPLKIASPAEAKPPAGYAVEDGGFYKSAGEAKPEIGDVRVSFQVVEPTTVSVVAQQKGKSFQAYQIPGRSKTIDLLDVGDHDAESMFKEALEQNKTLTWILRAVGFLMMAVGIFLVMRPLSVMGDVIPFIGGMIGALLGVVAALIAAALSLITISIAWLFYRPLIGVPLLLAGIGVLVLVFFLARRRKPVPTEKPA
jgi:hypothetical protein